MNRKTKKLAVSAMCAALAIILSYLESLLPPLFAGLPGIKMGLPNIVMLYLLYTYGWGYAAAVSLIRLCAVAMLFGSITTFAYSLCGAVLSLTVMALLKHFGLLSPLGVSVAGGVCHNIGQIAVAMTLFATPEIGYYLPVLLISGTLAGILVGLCGHLLLRYGKKLR